MKKLEDMGLEELWQMFPIVLKGHDPQYTAWYKEEQENLLCVFESVWPKRISHIGSTAVEGLIAKPIVDILLELPKQYNMDIVSETLCSKGWRIMSRDNKEQILHLNKGYTQSGFAEQVFHLHIKPLGDWNELYFRDYLIAYADIAQEYEKLKLSLKDCYEYNRDAYTDAKSDFVLKYTKLARQEFGDRYSPNIIEIREAVLSDLPLILELYTYLHDNAMPVIDEKLEALWNEIISDLNHHVLVGIIEDRIISSCVLLVVSNMTHTQRPYALIENVITQTEYRGKGYATAILNQAKVLAQKYGCYKIMLMTSSKNEATLHFYENAGYNCNDKTAFIQWLE